MSWSDDKRAREALAEQLLAAATLIVAGASLGLAVWQALQGSALTAYLVGNDRSAVAFRAALPCMLTGAWVVLGGAWLAATFAGEARASTFERWAARCSPLMLSALLPPLWQWEPWVEQPLAFLGLLVLIAVGARLSLTRALLATDVAVPARDAAVSTKFDARAPLVIVLGAAAGYCAYFGYYSVQRHHNLQTSAFDLGIFDNLLWNAADRYSFSLPSSPAEYADFRHLERHATFIALLLAPIYARAPRAETLLWMQAAGVALAAVPLFFIARRRLGAWSACLLAIGYLLYPPVHGPTLFDFHFILLGPLCLWTSVALLEARRDWLAALAIALSLSVREDVAVGVAMIGAYLIMTRQRPRAGLLLCAIGCAYVGVTKLVIMPGKFAGAGSFVDIYGGLVPNGAKGFGAVLQTVLANPAFTWKTLLTYDKLLYALQIAAPLALLPWLRAIGWICSLPGLLFCLLATEALPLVQISFQYTPHWTTYLFLALIVNVEWLSQHAESEAHGLSQKRAALAAFALCMLLGSHQFGGILQQNTLRAGFDVHGFGSTAEQRADYEAVRALVAKIPKDARVVASEYLVAQISNRRYAYSLRHGLADAEYLLLTTATDPRDDEREPLSEALGGRAWGVVDVQRAFVLVQRGADPSRNARVRRSLK